MTVCLSVEVNVLTSYLQDTNIAGHSRLYPELAHLFLLFGIRTQEFALFHSYPHIFTD